MRSIIQFSLALGLVGGIFSYAPLANAQAVSDRPGADVAAATKLLTPELFRGWQAIEQGDYITAFQTFEQYAIQGNALAQTTLGDMYSSGKGVPQDYALAVNWYRKAADQGFAAAQTKLAMRYYYGKGVPQDYAIAARWYRKAADQGNLDSQYLLGLLYFLGQGVPEDFVQSHKWLNLAVAGGRASATDTRNIVASEMTAAQIAEAQRLAREWRKKE